LRVSFVPQHKLGRPLRTMRIAGLFVPLVTAGVAVQDAVLSALEDMAANAVVKGRRAKPAAQPKPGRAVKSLIAGSGDRTAVQAPVEQVQEYKNSKLAVDSTLSKEETVKAASPVTTDAWKSGIHGLVGSASSRFVASPDVGSAISWIQKEMSAAGLSVRLQDFHIDARGTQVTATNVIGTCKGSDSHDRFVVLGAHYDSIPAEGPAPGADDNGSGVTSVLLAAKSLCSMKLKLNVEFVAFSGEELGLHGSTAYVSQMTPDQRHKFQGAIILDEVGLTRTPKSPEVIFETKGEMPPQMGLIDTLAESAKAVEPDVGFVVNYHGWGSDHMPFLERAMPAVLLIEKDNLFSAEEYGHSPRDRIENLDFHYGAQLARIATATIARMATPRDEISLA